MSVGSVRTEAPVGNVGTDVSVGSVKTEAPVGNVGTDVSVGSVKTEASVGNVGTKVSVGRVRVARLVGSVGVTTIGNVTESVAEFKTLAMDESIPTSVVVGGELDRTDVTAALTSLMTDGRRF